MYSPVSLLTGIYPLPAMHSLLVASGVRNLFKYCDLTLTHASSKKEHHFCGHAFPVHNSAMKI